MTFNLLNMDAKAATIILLKADAGVSSEVSGRVYYDAESFRQNVQNMPQKAISIARSGGLEDRGYSANTTERLDLRCWGETEREAWRVHQAASTMLKNFVPKELFQLVDDPKIKVFNYVRQGGPNELRDPDEGWPFVWSSWLVKFSTVAINS